MRCGTCNQQESTSSTNNNNRSNNNLRPNDALVEDEMVLRWVAHVSNELMESTLFASHNTNGSSLSPEEHRRKFIQKTLVKKVCYVLSCTVLLLCFVLFCFIPSI